MSQLENVVAYLSRLYKSSRSIKGWITQAVFALAVLLSFEKSLALENGLARTPPMGWTTWQRFRCTVDCFDYPDTCINEQLIQRTVRRLVEDGWRDSGYRYVIIDDCWQYPNRDSVTGEIVADPERFPEGMGRVSDMVHANGLLFGLYMNYGILTCEGYPGSMDHLELDANSLAKWQVDYVKVDGCYSLHGRMPGGFEEFGKYLNKTGRPMIYACNYPSYIEWRTNSSLVDWERLKNNCNLWRITPNIQDSWTSVLSIIEIYKNYGSVLNPISGPGHWNDPDTLVLGNFGLSREQQHVQMGMWCMLAAPLIISTDLDTIDEESAILLQNPLLLMINQDPGGHNSQYLGERDGVQLWIRKLDNEVYTSVVTFLYTSPIGGPVYVTISLQEMGVEFDTPMNGDQLFTLTDVFSEIEYECIELSESITVYVNPTGIEMYLVELYDPDYLDDWFDSEDLWI
ncbi:hypothetical protein P879_02002 [Paragonimus westermani]|uniref:Alpha-galactosidase n=1 Tax=Paragonimus westermani TaxID=34504 RepID=A0A8T0DIW9_9TREM|nr:hypothetical protein P879_02002 [Paragonimus westermani]